MIKYLLLLLLLCQSVFSFSQESKNFQLHFSISYGDSNLVLHHAYLDDSSTTTLSKLQWYLSNFSFTLNDSVVWTETNSFHLLDITRPSSLTLNFSIPNPIQYDAITCILGIDSTTQMSGVYGGDLDPTTGMYWTWNSGYIHVKLEGVKNTCPTRKNQFQFHVGGFQGEYNSIQQMKWFLNEGNQATVTLSLDTFMEAFDCKTKNRIMSPGKEAVNMASLFAKSFQVQ